MSERLAKAEPASEPDLPPRRAAFFAALVRVARIFGGLGVWAQGHWLRSLIVACVILAAIGLTIAGWTYLAGIAIRSGHLTVEAALAALDEGRYEETRMAVGRMLQSGHLPRSEFGGPLFVLGAIKVHDAESQAAADRRRVEYLVASRYLAEARAYGFPPQHEADGLFLLGKSLVESGQFADGVRLLDELLSQVEAEHQRALEAHQLLVETCLWMPRPRPQKALEHSSAVLSHPSLPEEQRAGVLLQRAECLARLGRFDEARQAVTAASELGQRSAEIELMRGKLVLDELAEALDNVAAADRDKVSGEWRTQVAEAVQHLQQAATDDAQKSHVTRQTAYQLARSHELLGELDAALAQYTRMRQGYAETFEGLAAALSEADLLRQKRDYDGAVLGYRRVLEAFKNIAIYRSVALPLPQVRERLMVGLKDLIERERFADALALLDHFPPLFSRTEQLELRGGTLEQWGNLLLSRTANEAGRTDEQRREGRQRLRAAGVAYEQLAEQRFATRFYTADLWRAAENFFRGHSFTRTVRLLNQYLDNEPELRNAQALLRLGQAQLARREFAQSIAAFEECIEFHPRDPASYQSRIDCAKAYWYQGNSGRAEALLRENLVGSTLRPSSREWKDSLFELGMLLYETGRHEEAIEVLEEAIERYPQDPLRLVVQYLIGEAYRQWGRELLERAEQARAASERQKSVQLAIERFDNALKHFEEVQVGITFKSHDVHRDPLMGAMLRNCYMLEGAVLFELGQFDQARYKEAIAAYSNVASLYPDDPFVLETFVQIANCWRRLGRQDNARGAIHQAQIALDSLPADASFATTTILNREEWRMLLADMSRW